MSEEVQNSKTEISHPIPFKAETRQLLNILIHSLYSEREIFLRELISNASDALTRLEFEQLTKREIHDPQAELFIRIIADKEERTLTIIDTGIGMTQEELIENLGTIAHSGVRAFIEAAKGGNHNVSALIGQFGVGFYSAFMVAEWIRVVSRSYIPGARAAFWYSEGSETFNVGLADKSERGTEVVIKLKEDAMEFLEESRLREVIRKHSDFIPYPIYLGDSKEQVNRRTALWRQQPRQVTEKEYNDFYQQLTLDFSPPLAHAHMVVDAPVQMYALLYIPASPERHIFSPRKDDGLKLYSRKVLIQEYCKELLPEYLTFVQGVVDSEDLPLNISRESVQAGRVMANLKKLVTSKVLDTLKQLAEQKPDIYAKFWKAFGRYIKQGVATEPGDAESLYPLLRFRTTANPDTLSSLDEYIQRMKPDQKEIYYLLGDDDQSILFSPHLDAVRAHNYEVLLLTDPFDSLMLVGLTRYRDYPLVNVASPEVKLPPYPQEAVKEGASFAETSHSTLIERFKSHLGDKVAEVRLSTRLVSSPARLVDAQGTLNPELQRLYKLLNREFEAPKKILEINPNHPIINGLKALSSDSPLLPLIIEQIYEDALLIEGLHPNPASMIERMQKIMEIAITVKG